MEKKIIPRKALATEKNIRFGKTRTRVCNCKWQWHNFLLNELHTFSRVILLIWVIFQNDIYFRSVVFEAMSHGNL